MEKIKFQTNIPIELALKFTEGKLCDSQFGDPQYMFTTTDDRCFFVAEKVAQKIHGLRLQPGEVIDIVKAEVPYGNGRKGIEWQISRVGDTAPENGAGAATPAPSLPPAAQMPVRTARASSNGHVTSAQTAPPPPRSASTIEDNPAPLLPWALFLLGQTKQLVDVYAHALEYAGDRHGNAVKPEDVRGLITTAYIAMTKNGASNVG